jgi:hypothetical protein
LSIDEAIGLLRNFRFSLTQKRCIESRIASTGNRPLGGCQTSENIALARDDVLAKLRRISITAAHNIICPCNASSRKFFLVLLQAFEHVVCLNGHTAALSFKFLAARYRSSSVSRIVLRLSSRRWNGNREKPHRNNRRDGAKAGGLLHDLILPKAMISQLIERNRLRRWLVAYTLEQQI